MTPLEIGGLVTSGENICCDVIVCKTVKIRKQICNFIFFIMSMLYQKWMLKSVNLCKQAIKIAKLMESAKN